MRQTITFLKGHGTGNDFVILPDPDAELRLDEDLVARLCHRRLGVGGDGVLRVARAGKLVDAGVLGALPDGVDGGDWFMDYYNADGSAAEMCGNGVRVFAHYVVSRGLAEGPGLRVGTRAGLRPVTVADADARSAAVTVGMGDVAVLGAASARVGGAMVGGVGVDVGNPHLACVLPGADAEAIAALPLGGAGEVEGPADMFPRGLNLEVLTPLRDGAVDMRVIERGVGETLSCGTGTVAAAVAALADAGEIAGSVTVRVPGGAVVVDLDGDGGATLTGPSVIHSGGSVDPAALEAPPAR